MPKKTTPNKSQCEVHSESEEDDEDDDKPQSCIYCMKKILCVPQNSKKVCVACGQHKVKCEYFDKTAWAVMEGSQKIVESLRELVELKERLEAGRLEAIWHNLQMCLRQLKQKSKGVEVPADVEKQIQAEHGLVQSTLKDHTEDITEQMDDIQACTAWNNNGLPKINASGSPPQVASQGTKRKGDEERDHAEGSSDYFRGMRKSCLFVPALWKFCDLLTAATLLTLDLAIRVTTSATIHHTILIIIGNNANKKI
ncbi:hypothetical protein M422DRAFT_247734 [Sphaerobolus stellatus SS14]|nr:hypothetical protein M422DRAFT_247734 [Sphaerobolus stellatus SS14]